MCNKRLTDKYARAWVRVFKVVYSTTTLNVFVLNVFDGMLTAQSPRYV